MAKRPLLLLMVTLGVITFLPQAGLANHPVLVEGESDFDGDGLLGVDEDTDGSDGVFGTIAAALGADNGGVNQNGSVTIVTSGRFVEQINITGANGNVVIQAAPGVDANIDAVLSGLSGNAERQNQPGIIVDAPANRRIVLRHLNIRNWLVGIQVQGESQVVIEGCYIEHNLNYGVRVMGRSNATIGKCTIDSTGFRKGAAGDSPDVDRPRPGTGISFENASGGLVANSKVVGNFFGGIVNRAIGSTVFTETNLLYNNPANSVGRLLLLNQPPRR